MSKEKRKYDSEFKAAVAFEAIRGRFSVGELSEKYDLHPSLIHSWRKKVMESAYLLMTQAHKPGDSDEDDTRDKDKEIERLNAENQWLRKVAQRMSPSERREAVEVDNPALPLLRQVKLLNINRSSVYYKKRRQSEAGSV